MSRDPMRTAGASLPAVDEIARRITDRDEPDDVARTIAVAVHARLLAHWQKAMGLSCIGCRHRTSPGSTKAYVGICSHPLLATSVYQPASDTLKTRRIDCWDARSDQLSRHGGEASLCGPNGMLHEAAILPRLAPYLRAYARWLRWIRTHRVV